MNEKMAFVVIWLVPEADKENNKKLEKEIRESVKCDWLKEIEKVTVCTT